MGNTQSGRASAGGARRSVGKIAREDVRYVQRLRHACGISDEVYEDMKRSVGVESTLDLDHQRYQQLLRRIREAGGDRGEEVFSRHASAKASGMHQAPAPEVTAQLRKIGALLAEMKLPWSYADGIVRQMYRVPRVRWCGPKQLSAVITALVKKQRKAAAADAERSSK